MPATHPDAGFQIPDTRSTHRGKSAIRNPKFLTGEGGGNSKLKTQNSKLMWGRGRVEIPNSEFLIPTSSFLILDSYFLILRVVVFAAFDGDPQNSADEEPGAEPLPGAEDGLVDQVIEENRAER